MTSYLVALQGSKRLVTHERVVRNMVYGSHSIRVDENSCSCLAVNSC